MNATGDLAMLGRVMGGLIVVLVLIGLVARIAKRTRGHNGDTGLRVVDRVGLSREANLAVVEVSNRMLLLGVTAQGVTMLADLADSDHQPHPGGSRNTLRHEVIHQDIIEPEADRLNDSGPNTTATTHSDADLGGLEVIHPVPNPVPTGIALDQYPDLASALRAAGRVATPEAPAGGRTQNDGPTGTSRLPRTRAQARAARSNSAGRSWIPLQRGRSVTDDEDTPRPARSGASSVQNSRRVAPPSQASGSVLSPRTWRQGIEALRELTVRRG